MCVLMECANKRSYFFLSFFKTTPIDVDYTNTAMFVVPTSTFREYVYFLVVSTIIVCVSISEFICCMIDVTDL